MHTLPRRRGKLPGRIAGDAFRHAQLPILVIVGLVMGEPRRGRKVVIAGDSAPCEMTRLIAWQADLLVHDELFSLWRQRHILMVERQIGTKRGTGGSSGAPYLRTTLDKRFFPELWELRSDL